MSEIKYVVHYGVPFVERKKLFDTKQQAEEFIKTHVFIGRTILNKDGSVNKIESDTIYLEKVEKLDTPFTVVSAKDPAVSKCRSNDEYAIDRKSYEKAKFIKTESTSVKSVCDKILAGENIRSVVLGM